MVHVMLHCIIFCRQYSENKRLVESKYDLM